MGALTLACGREIGGGAPVTPAYRDFGFRRDGVVDVHADLGQVTVSQEPLAVVIVIDRTASMTQFIGDATARAFVIVEGIRAIYPRATFRIAFYADAVATPSESGFDWAMPGFDADPRAVQQGLGSSRVANGTDWPEQPLAALDEIRRSPWPTGARRIALIIGDAPSRIPDRAFDGRLLDVATVGRELARDSILLFAAQVDHGPMRKETKEQFAELAQATGGERFTLNSADGIVKNLKAGLERLLKPAPRLSASAEFSSWVELGDYLRTEAAHNRFQTHVRIRVPPSAPEGIHRVPVYTVAGAGATDTIGVTVIDVRKGILFLPWRWPLLLLYLLLCSIAFIVRRIMINSALPPLFYGDRPWFLLAVRCAMLAVIVVGAILIWTRAPGHTTPPAQANYAQFAEP